MWHDAEVNIFLYHVEYEVKLGVYVCVCVCVRALVQILMWVGLSEWSKKKVGGGEFFFKISDHWVKGHGRH